MNKKPWYESKTIWVNVLILIAAVAGAVQDVLTTGQAVTTMGLVNVVLRVISEKSITWFR